VRTGSLESLRELNRLRVVETLRERGTASRAEIARVTGLSRSTVSSLVSDLQAHGLIVEHSDPDAPASMATGRPPTLLSLDRSAGAVVGIDFGHDRIHAAVSDLSRTVLAEAVRPEDVDHDAEDALDTAADLANDLLAETGLDHGDVIGVGMALSGPIDHDRGAVRPTAILPGWEGLEVAAEMSRRLGDLPVHLDNDANLGALAETLQGAAQGTRSAAYIKISGGVGAGLVMDGQIFRGPDGTAGEIGHASLDEYGAVCRCGNRGCLETLVRTPVLLRLLEPTHGANLTVARMVELAHGGDIACRRLIMDAGRQVGLAAANMCNLLNPERIVLGGELSQAADLLIEPMQDVISRHGIPSAARRVQIVQAALGSRSQVLGAVALALRAADRSAARFPDMIQKLNI
jgi:predicted NBD/HSP70 family sugar kinase